MTRRAGVFFLSLAAAFAVLGGAAADTFGYKRFKPYRAIPIIRPEPVSSIPHDTDAFTEGLIFFDGRLYESTGRCGSSALREIDPDTGRVLRRAALPAEVFGEGLALCADGTLAVLTWRRSRVFFFDRESFSVRRELGIRQSECWGLAALPDSKLIMSDGSPRLSILDCETFAELGFLDVAEAGAPLDRINELEFVGGWLFANVWRLPLVAVIDIKSGEVAAWIDFGGIARSVPVGADGENVLNGIAFDPGGGRLFISGKNWPRIFVFDAAALLKRVADET